MSLVLAERRGALGRISLNRPEALHALNLEMVEALIAALRAFRDEDGVRRVVIDHAAGRGFCAGGDIRMLAESGSGDGREARAFFGREYQLNAFLMAYPKPLLAVMDGVVMGGGVGVALPCGRRIATERTTFAMPETGIGLFPDVGGGWHLSRLPGESGMWLALTGARLKAADCLSLGLATDVLPADALPGLLAALEAPGTDPAAALAERAAPAAPAPLEPHRALIDRAFAAGSVEAILAALEAEPEPFAAEQAAVLRTKSPQTLKVAHRQLRAGRALVRFEDEMVMEFRIAARVVARHDFQEGVRAVIVDKDNAPRWDPPTLEGVGEDLLDAIFAPLPPAEEWRPLEDAP